MNIFKILYQIFCIAGAVGMSLFCVLKYLKNESVVSVSYKVFHDTPDDVYPSISICFYTLNQYGPFVNTSGINKQDIARMMKGEKEYNQSLFENITYEDMTMKLSVLVYMYIEEITVDIVKCDDFKCFKTYGDGIKKCFSHDIKYAQGKIYKSLNIRVKKTKKLMETVMQIFFHHPGQLFRTGHDPVYEGVFHKNRERIIFKVQSVTTRQKRKDDREKCNHASFDDDEILFENEVKKYNCAAKYKGQYLYKSDKNINKITHIKVLIPKMLQHATALN